MQNKVEIFPPPKKKITGEILFEKGNIYHNFAMVVLARKP